MHIHTLIWNLSFADSTFDTVVCFCSVGYRSAKMVQMIQDEFLRRNEDFSQMAVFNLEGSIFKWANEDRVMVDIHGNQTTFCHPYSTIWGKFLDNARRKWEASSPTCKPSRIPSSL